MANEQVTETCKCGAKLTYTGYYTYAKEQLATFRANHMVCLTREDPKPVEAGKKIPDVWQWGGEQ